MSLARLAVGPNWMEFSAYVAEEVASGRLDVGRAARRPPHRSRGDYRGLPADGPGLTEADRVARRSVVPPPPRPPFRFAASRVSAADALARDLAPLLEEGTPNTPTPVFA